jgi:hypothetical protein
VEIRYLGFDQRQNFRVYRFDVRSEGRLAKEVSISADISMFRNHSIGIQEGPFLCGKKLTADLQRGWEGEHELTAADLQVFAETKALANASHAGARKGGERRGSG